MSEIEILIKDINFNIAGYLDQVSNAMTHENLLRCKWFFLVLVNAAMILLVASCHVKLMRSEAAIASSQRRGSVRRYIDSVDDDGLHIDSRKFKRACHISRATFGVFL